MLYSNTEAATALGLADMELGPDEITVLQVNGTPVFVNPESMIIANTQASTALGLVDMEMGPDEITVL